MSVESPARDRRMVAADRREPVQPSAILTVLSLLGVLVLWLWWHDTSATLHGVGDWLTNAGRITGLVGGYLLAVQLLLMSRAPVLERSVGSDRLARWHAANGRYTVSVLLAHALLIWWGYAVQAHTGLVGQGTSLLLTYPDVLMATVAMGLLVGVGVISARRVRKRMAYETWFYLHLYTYLAVALAFSHQFAVGVDFMHNKPARWAWSLLYIVVVGAVLWYRFITPVRQNIRHRLRVAEVRREGPGTVSIVIRGEHLDELRAEPGQFFRWRFLTRNGWWQSHPYSLSAPPHSRWLRITVKNLGDHSEELLSLPRGTRVFAEGPYGAITAARQRQRAVVLLAGGIGITPLRSLFETLPGRGSSVALLYRVNSEKEILFREELDEISNRRDAPVRYIVGPPGGANDIFVGERLTRMVPDVKNRDVYLCGPPGFIAAARAALRRVGVPSRHVHVESFEF